MTLIFCDASFSQVENLKMILKWFEWLSGLKINYGKCELIGVKVDGSQVDYLANVFGCKVGNLPSKYLGLPLCLGLPKKHLWDSVLKWIEKKLSSWKCRYLSMGGRLTLIKSFLVLNAQKMSYTQLKNFSVTFSGTILLRKGIITW